jgi:hypothetical protein
MSVKPTKECDMKQKDSSRVPVVALFILATCSFLTTTTLALAVIAGIRELSTMTAASTIVTLLLVTTLVLYIRKEH